MTSSRARPALAAARGKAVASPRPRRWTPWRRAVQAAVALFYLGLPVAHLAGVQGVSGTLASLELGPVDLNEPAAALAAVLAGGQVHAVLVLGTVPVILLALVLGPVFCSWVCPWGLLSEGVDRLRRGRRRKRPAWPAGGYRRWRRPRAAVLAALLGLSLLLGTPLAATLSAPRLITSLPLELITLKTVAPLTGLLLLALLALEILGPRRLWCRALCPAGSVANLLRTPWTRRPAYDAAACLDPGTPVCQTVCPWGIDPRHMGRFDGCTNCMACVDGCPTRALAAS